MYADSVSESSGVKEESTDTDESNESSGDFDDLLDSFESFCNDYISLLRKASNGDMTALSEYPAVMKNAQDLSEKLEQAQGSATAEQWDRFLKIQRKFLNAASDMN